MKILTIVSSQAGHAHARLAAEALRRAAGALLLLQRRLTAADS